MSDTPGNEPLHDRPRRLPRLSGKLSAFWLVVCFLLTALLIPAVLRLPRWIEYEIVLAVWWVIWFLVLTRLLYSGRRVSDDHQRKTPGSWFTPLEPAESDAKSGRKQKAAETEHSSGSSWWDGFFWGRSSHTDAEGCLIAIGIVLAVILAVALVWFLIEVAIPVVLFLLYVVARGMLANVINDRHRCRGDLARALAWGFLWATLYTLPLAGVVWLVHYVQAR